MLFLWFRKLSAPALLLVVMFVSSCANQRVWVNPSKNNEEAQKDFRECKYDSDKNSFVAYGDGRSPVSAGIQEAFQGVNLMSECMRSRGYYLVSKNDLENKRNEQSKTKADLESALKLREYSKALDILSTILMV